MKKFLRDLLSIPVAIFLTLGILVFYVLDYCVTQIKKLL